MSTNIFSNFKLSTLIGIVLMVNTLTGPFAMSGWCAKYEILNLTKFDGKSACAFDINNTGQIVGSVDTTGNDDISHAFLWDAEKGMRDLGTLGGNKSCAYGINDSGQVVGSAQLKSGEMHAFLWDVEKGMRDLGTLGGKESSAMDINNAGQVVGWAFNKVQSWNGNKRAFRWDIKKGMRDLGTLGGYESCANSINNAGQIVGWTHWGNSNLTGNYKIHAFLWDETKKGMRDLGTLGGVESCAYCINDAGQVVGWSKIKLVENTNEWTVAFIWDAAQGMRYIDEINKQISSRILYSMACCINNSGEVVGWTHINNDKEHAFIWDIVNGTRDLGMLNNEWNSISSANSINETGQVVGWITSYKGIPAVLWQPEKLKDSIR